MTLDEAKTVIQAHLDRMNTLYGQPVFDEWAIVFVAGEKGRLLHYVGPRRDDFQRNFAADVEPLREEVGGKMLDFGEFEFAHASVGTRFDAGMVLGEGLYLLCNNTQTVTSGITQNPRWRDAQVPFVELSEKLRSHPLIHPL